MSEYNNHLVFVCIVLASIMIASAVEIFTTLFEPIEENSNPLGKIMLLIIVVMICSAIGFVISTKIKTTEKGNENVV